MIIITLLKLRNRRFTHCSYNIPARTGNNIDYKTVARLSKYQNIVGIKDSSGNFDNTLRYIEDTDERISGFGNDSLILWTLGREWRHSRNRKSGPSFLLKYTALAKGEIKKANELQKN